MARIVVVGGGFAGVWGAAAAARYRGDGVLDVTLIAPNDEFVIRPRLYEPDPARKTVPMRGILEPIGVEQIRAGVTDIDVGARCVVTDQGTTLAYDRLVLAAGSHLVRPEFPGAAALFDVDSLAGATRLAAHLHGRPTFTAVVVGAGFTGLEIATRLADRGTVVLIERGDVVGPELGPGPRPQIEAALEQTGVELRLGTTVRAIEDREVLLGDGARITADAVIWAAGLRASPLAARIPGPKDRLGRVVAGPDLSAGDGVFVAGDVAAAPVDGTHTTVQSCQHATPLGKTAGHNAAASVLGLPLIDFVPAPYVTDIDLGDAGAILTRGWDRAVELTGPEGKRMKQWIMRRISPPVGDARAMLDAAARIANPIPTIDQI